MASALRGSGLGGMRAVHLPDPVETELAPRQRVSFWCAEGHESRLSFADDAVPPETERCRSCGALAGQTAGSPPSTGGVVPYKTHLQYMQERRSTADAEALLAEAIAGLRARG